MTDENSDVHDAIDDAVETAAEERSAEVEAAARADEREKALIARLEALEQRGTASTTLDTSAISAAVSEALGPFNDRLAALEKQPEPTPEPEPVPTPEPEPPSDPFAPQIDFAAMARNTREEAPKITHTLFRKFGRR